MMSKKTIIAGTLATALASSAAVATPMDETLMAMLQKPENTIELQTIDNKASAKKGQVKVGQCPDTYTLKDCLGTANVLSVRRKDEVQIVSTGDLKTTLHRFRDVLKEYANAGLNIFLLLGPKGQESKTPEATVYLNGKGSNPAKHPDELSYAISEMSGIKLEEKPQISGDNAPLASTNAGPEGVI